MNPAVTEFLHHLKEARESRGLSQRALGEKVGLPQSHISKIERGAVDIQTSTLIDLARVLDLELMLVPRKLVPAFTAAIRASRPDHPGGPDAARPAYSLEDGDDA